VLGAIVAWKLIAPRIKQPAPAPVQETGEEQAAEISLV
jgi:hypothetical protein